MNCAAARMSSGRWLVPLLLDRGLGALAVKDAHHFLGGAMESEEAEILSAFLRQFYLETTFIPAQLHLPLSVPDADEIAAWLSAKSGARVELAAPQRGLKAKMLDLAETNAAHLLKERQLKRELPGNEEFARKSCRLADVPEEPREHQAHFL